MKYRDGTQVKVRLGEKNYPGEIMGAKFDLNLWVVQLYKKPVEMDYRCVVVPDSAIVPEKDS